MVTALLSMRRQRFKFIVVAHLTSRHQRFNTFVVVASTKNQQVVTTNLSSQHQYCALFIVSAGYHCGSHDRYFGYQLQLPAGTIRN
jgi:hypothetical protein